MIAVKKINRKGMSTSVKVIGSGRVDRGNYINGC